MKTKFLKATLAAVCIVATGVGSWKAYSAYEQNGDEADLLLTENIEAMSSNTEASGYYVKSTGSCSDPCGYKRWVACKTGGKEDCSPSDCC